MRDAVGGAVLVGEEVRNRLVGRADQTAGGMTALVDDEGQLGPVVGLAAPRGEGLAAGGSKVGRRAEGEGLLAAGEVFGAHLDLAGIVGSARGDVEGHGALAFGVTRGRYEARRTLELDVACGWAAGLGVHDGRGRQEDGEQGGGEGVLHLGYVGFKQ